MHAPSQWGTTLQCSVVSDWQDAYTQWSLQIVCGILSAAIEISREKTITMSGVSTDIVLHMSRYPALTHSGNLKKKSTKEQFYKVEAVLSTVCGLFDHPSGINLGMESAKERRHYIVTPSVISWAHIHNGPCPCKVHIKLFPPKVKT